MERAWCVDTKKGSSLVAIGFDTGSIVIQLGDDKPLLSMDPMGKIIWCKHNDVFHTALKVTDVENVEDGNVISLAQKELGSVEVFPTSLIHSPNGRFVAVTGDEEYIIYTALAWRNKTFGSALDFVWAQDSNYYAIRESKSSVKIFKNFKELSSIDLVYSAEKIYGGSLLTIKSEGFVSFYDWETSELVRRVNVDADNVIWSDSGELVLIISQNEAYALSFQRDLFLEALQNGEIDSEEGVEACMDVLYQIEDDIISGKWVGDVFIYTSASNRLNYLVGGATYNLAHFDKGMYLLGYMQRDNKVYVCDKDVNVSGYSLSISVLEYETVVMRGDMELADELLKEIPESEYGKISRFLEQQGYKDKALELSQDNDQKFDLALSIMNLDLAKQIAEEANNTYKWKKLGDLALNQFNFKLAIDSFKSAGDYQTSLLILSSMNDQEGLKELSTAAKAKGQFNTAFAASWAAGDKLACLELLKDSERWTEGALFARNFGITGLDEVVGSWKANLTANGKAKLADRIITPESASVDETAISQPEEVEDEQEVAEEEPAANEEEVAEEEPEAEEEELEEEFEEAVDGQAAEEDQE